MISSQQGTMLYPTPIAPTSSSGIVPTTIADASHNKKRPSTIKKTSAGGSGVAMDTSVPLFLRKTFDLIEHADPEIASWSEDGLTFVIKDVKAFTDDIIPSYFNHKNFSSFVRQLNFYGFRKVKDESLKINHEPSIEDKYYKFRHPMFQRGRVDLLPGIKKSSQTEVAEKSEVDALKAEVKTLKDQLMMMNRNMEAVTTVVHDLLQKEERRQKEEQKRREVEEQQLKERQQAQQDDFPNKKRRISTYDDQTPSTDQTVQPMDVTSCPPSTSQQQLLQQQPETYHSNHQPPSLPVKEGMTAQPEQSIGSLGELDDELFATLMALDDDERIAVCTKELSLPDTHVSLPEVNKHDDHNRPDPKLVERLRSSLASLPKNMQELFVERLVKALASPEAFQDQVEAVNALASAAAAEAQKRIHTGTDHAGDVMEALNHQQKVQLATAVLGSFLAHYGSAIPDIDNAADNAQPPSADHPIA